MNTETSLHGADVEQVTIPAGYLQDYKGRFVPISSVDEWELEQDAMVKELCRLAHEHQEALRAFKRFAYGECYTFLDLLAEKYNRKKGGAKGNVSFTSYDGQLQVRISIQDTSAFGPELQIAKAMIEEHLHETLDQNSNPTIQAMAAEAFQLNSKGEVDVAKALRLRKYKIKDPKWLQAMDIIADAVIKTSSKSYINFYERNDEKKLVGIPLTFAAL